MKPFNPLHPFEPRFLPAFRQKGVIAFVKQSYQRGRNMIEGLEKTFVLIHFEKQLAAQQYFDVLKDDPERELLYLKNAIDETRIKELISGGNCFMMLKIKDAEERARKILDKKIKFFIENKCNWHPSRQDEVRFSLDVQFGEVYARLNFRSREIKVKLEEIERCSVL